MDKLVIFFDNAPSMHKEGIIQEFSLLNDILIIHFPLLSDEKHFSESSLKNILFENSRLKIIPSVSKKENLIKIKNFINKKINYKSYKKISILYSFLDIYRLSFVLKLKTLCKFTCNCTDTIPFLEPIRLNDFYVLPRLIRLFISLTYQKIYLKSNKVFIYASLNSFIYKLFFREINLIPYKKIKNKIFSNKEVNDLIIKHKKLRILFIGKLIDRKNPMILIKAFEKLKFDAELTIVGEGYMADKIKNKCKKIMDFSDSHIKIFNRLDNQQVNDLMSEHDVLVLPSKFDGFGFVVSEAIDSKVYVIVSNKVGSKDLIHNGKIGAVFKNNSLSELQNLLNLHYLRSI